MASSQSINIDKYRTAKKRPLVEADPVKRMMDSPGLPPDLRERFRDGAFRRKVESRTNELLRQLKARARQRLMKHDSAEARAAVTLEHVLRTSDDGSAKAVPLEALRSSQLGLPKKKALEELQRTLGHYIGEIEGNQRKRQTGGSHTSHQSRFRTKSAAAGDGGYDALSGRSHSGVGQPEIIRDLSIRLGSIVHDAEGSARRAEALFGRIKEHMESSAEHRRGARLSDLRRHQAAYESACFYVSVKESEGNVVGKSAGSDGEDEERNLTVADVAAAAKLSREAVKDILPEVEKMSGELKLRAASRILPSQKRSNSRKEDQREGKKQRGANDASARRGSRSDETMDGLLPSMELRSQGDTVEDADTQDRVESVQEESHAYLPSAKYLEWKNRVVSEAIEKVRKKCPGEKLSNQDALDMAANDVINRRS